jgi:hypothetical protein
MLYGWLFSRSSLNAFVRKYWYGNQRSKSDPKY